jgi:neurotransmitter:Na+ symporter, NSS family
VSFLIQLIRSPYLILENGGGAFLILFFISLHLIFFPLLVAEKVLDQKLKNIDLTSLIYIKNFPRKIRIDSLFVIAWFSLRFVIIFSLLWFFLYLGSNSIIYALEYLKINFGISNWSKDYVIFNNLDNPYWGIPLFCGIVFYIFSRIKKPFFNISVRYFLPFILSLFALLFFKTILSIESYSGIKILLYPDFSALNSSSLISIIGHGLSSLFIGIGFYDHSIFKKLKKDPIDIFIHIILQTLVLSFFVGLMVLPLIEQVGEIPYGAHFIFDILPRWLAYGQFGQYYNLLYFLSLSYLCLYLSVFLSHLLNKNASLLYAKITKKNIKFFFNIAFVILNIGVVFLLQIKMGSWQAQSFLLKIDNILINVLMPILALLMIWFVFRYTLPQERVEVFSKQQVFFHNRVFFNLWQKLSLLLVPTLIIVSWCLMILGDR